MSKHTSTAMKASVENKEIQQGKEDVKSVLPPRYFIVNSLPPRFGKSFPVSYQGQVYHFMSGQQVINPAIVKEIQKTEKIKNIKVIEIK